MINNINLQIDFSKTGIEVTTQAAYIAKLYRVGKIEQDIAKTLLEPYFDWFYKQSKRITGKGKKIGFVYFIRSTAGIY
jgi:hypothetical protein